MSKAKVSYDKAEVDELFADAAPPTDDDVSITNDGRRLDSAEAAVGQNRPHRRLHRPSPPSGRQRSPILRSRNDRRDQALAGS